MPKRQSSLDSFFGVGNEVANKAKKEKTEADDKHSKNVMKGKCYKPPDTDVYSRARIASKDFRKLSAYIYKQPQLNSAILITSRAKNLGDIGTMDIFHYWR